MENQEYAQFHPFMKDSMNRYRVASLFWELRNTRDVKILAPLFTMKDRAHTVPSKDGKSLITYPSLKEIYMSYNHVPYNEYDFAMEIFGSWEHWKIIADSNTCCSMVASWREELAIKIKSKAVRNIMEASNSANAIGVNAARYLADEGYVPKKVGRISREERERVKKIAAGVANNLTEDMERLGLELVQGGK